MINAEETQNVTFLIYKNEDYDGFYTCINDFYEGGYPYKEYLDRKYLQKLTDAGDMVITIAKNINGHVVGTSAALKMSGRFEGSVLLLLRSVAKDMRGKGIGASQELFLLEQIQLHFPDALSLYADVMTHDAVSQTTMLKQGFVFCGLRMTLYKNDIIVPQLKYPDGTKMTQAIYCKSNHTVKNISIYAPTEHRDTLKEIYSSLGIVVDFYANDIAQNAISTYTIETSELHKKAEIFVDKHGYTEKLSKEIEELILSGYTAVAYINMSAVGFTETYNALKALGFYFSGVKPLSSNGEYLVLSNSRQCVPALDNIKLPNEAISLYKTITKEL